MTNQTSEKSPPTSSSTLARLKFISEFVPQSLNLSKCDTWELAQSLEEEMREKFPFTNKESHLVDAATIALCEIIVCQAIDLHRNKLLFQHVQRQLDAQAR